MEALRAHHAEIEDRSRQATVLIRRAYQTVGQQAPSVIPLGETEDDPTVNASQTTNGQPSNPRSRVPLVGQEVGGQTLSGNSSGGVMLDGSTQNNGAIPPANQANQSLRQPGSSVFDRLGTTHDLRDDLNRRRGRDEQNTTTNVQSEPILKSPLRKTLT
ncbi:hypothetical protein AMTR_s05646p00002950 [Amborella trichopoda]|uniref:Uncharacterized protein n=1 Tax=Amborella trichopoda TaxID=13333 RepID=U5CZK4_AMBTC|nr:hypothetical protein AMTR_s05646p00002950 [Amborella trichopoda]